ncbi:hypothetical protein IFM89_017940 [Coptis chinensis]|uniref:Uncharacterized protein n=1 Tax=Coptis chinensis TaxID=261450 RepID=A0A835HWC5_9MAGN|nr:hypothetical protein IFM89_017940 [Coptis chinensis]
MNEMKSSLANAMGVLKFKVNNNELDCENGMKDDVGIIEANAKRLYSFGFKKGRLKVLAHSFDSNLGGRDFDEVLFRHFVGKLRVSIRWMSTRMLELVLDFESLCEKLKKMLSANPRLL